MCLPYQNIEELKRQHDVATSELAEMEASFDLRWNADMRAIKRWQEAHPGCDDTWPDRADLVVWLMGELETERARLELVISMCNNPLSTVEQIGRDICAIVAGGLVGDSIYVDSRAAIDAAIEVANG